MPRRRSNDEMAERRDNENEQSRKSTKSYDTNKQDGGKEDTEGKKKGKDATELVDDPLLHTRSTPRIRHLEGLRLNPSHLQDSEKEQKHLRGSQSGSALSNNNNNNYYGGSSLAPGGDMKKFSRKKIGHENSLEENEPLKISVLAAAKNNSNSKEMEDSAKMEEIELSKAEDRSERELEEEGGRSSDRPQIQNYNERERGVLQNALDAFVSGVPRGKSQDSDDHDLDLNKNSSSKGDGGDGSERNKDKDSPKNKKPVPFHHQPSVERGDSFTIATKDDVDAGSVYSLYMENDFRYHFQHPYFRLFCAYFVVFCNFLIYAEDPVAHSRKECNIPVIGNDFAFVVIRWPPNAWSLLKVFMWIAGTLIGIVIGKVFIHAYLFLKVLRLKMFQEDRGSWMTMFLSTILLVFIFSQIYNLFLLAGGESTEDYRITSYLGLSNSIFMKAAATGTWCGDFFTAWMVTDMMLQERLYPGWAKMARKWWAVSVRRIVLFWVVVFISSFVVIFVIATDYIDWDSLNRDFLHSNEISRAFLASFILCMDIAIVMQDWDFPHFISAIDIKLPGLNTAHIRFQIPKLLKRLDYWQIHISGKWFNYGILFIVIILDLNMWKNQMFYNPFDYGQYTDSEGRIHSVKDDWSLDHASNRTIFSYDWRNTTINPLTNRTYISDDGMMNARYNDYPLALKGLAFVPSIAVFLVFGILVIIYGRYPKPTRENPYGGRLRKRRRVRFSARKKWNSLRTWMRDSSTPVLNAFRRRRDHNNSSSAATNSSTTAAAAAANQSEGGGGAGGGGGENRGSGRKSWRKRNKKEDYTNGSTKDTSPEPQQPSINDVADVAV